MIAVLQQVNEQVKYLRLHGYELAATAELTATGIENMVIEAEFHVRYRIFSQETIKSASSSGQSLLVASPASRKDRKL